jgi:hypothetical protein
MYIVQDIATMRKLYSSAFAIEGIPIGKYLQRCGGGGTTGEGGGSSRKKGGGGG